MKKILLILASIALVVMMQVPVFAQNTILPEAADTNSEADCETLLRTYEQEGYNTDVARNRNELLGCAIKTGRISLTMVPYFIQYFSNYALGLVSILALLFIVIGGLLYTVGGLSEQKDKGKNFIKNAIIGMIIAFMAWTIVNVIISAITG